MAISAEINFVEIPPVPHSLLEFWIFLSLISFNSLLWTSLIGCASLLLRGSFENRFSISVNKISLWASIAKATKAERVSLSPY